MSDAPLRPVDTPTSESTVASSRLADEPTRGRRAGFRARFDRLRARLDGFPRLRLLYKVLVAVLGFVIIVVGLLLVPLPGPGWLIVFVGVAVLGTEFPAAHRLTQWVRGLVRRARLRWRAWRVARSDRSAPSAPAPSR